MTQLTYTKVNYNWTFYLGWIGAFPSQLLSAFLFYRQWKKLNLHKVTGAQDLSTDSRSRTSQSNESTESMSKKSMSTNPELLELERSVSNPNSRPETTTTSRSISTLFTQILEKSTKNLKPAWSQQDEKTIPQLPKPSPVSIIKYDSDMNWSESSSGAAWSGKRLCSDVFYDDSNCERGSSVAIDVSQFTSSRSSSSVITTSHSSSATDKTSEINEIITHHQRQHPLEKTTNKKPFLQIPKFYQKIFKISTWPILVTAKIYTLATMFGGYWSNYVPSTPWKCTLTDCGNLILVCKVFLVFGFLQVLIGFLVFRIEVDLGLKRLKEGRETHKAHKLSSIILSTATIHYMITLAVYTTRVYEIPYPYVPYGNFKWGWSYNLGWIGCFLFWLGSLFLYKFC